MLSPKIPLVKISLFLEGAMSRSDVRIEVILLRNLDESPDPRLKLRHKLSD